VESAGIRLQRKRAGPAVGITTLGADRAGPILHRPVGRAWKGSSLGSEDQSCLHTYELLNKCDITPGFVLIYQGACQLNGIGTLLQPNDQPVLQCPHVSETSGESLAGPSGTSRIAAEGDDTFA
jgi:hypothetical protein